MLKMCKLIYGVLTYRYAKFREQEQIAGGMRF